MPYLSKQALSGLKHYHYKPGGYTILDNWHQPLWNYAVSCLPTWLAPNVITLIGLSSVMVANLISAYYSPDFQNPVPTWVYFAMAFAGFFYLHMDCLDGKQARRTGSSSPLGQLFDHGCDSLVVQLVVSQLMVSLGMSPDWRLVLGNLVVFTPFVLAHWEEYHTGHMVYGNGLWGVTEANYAVVLLHAAAGFGRGVAASHLAQIASTLGLGAALVALPAGAGGPVRLRMAAFGTAYALQLTRLIMAHMAKEPFRVAGWPLAAMGLQIVEDKTFGLKNKSKSKVVQKYVQQIQASQQPSHKQQRLEEPSRKDKKKAEMERQKELDELFMLTIKQPKLGEGVDPKTVLCEFHRHGKCTKGFKCKFSHDLNIERKTAKADVYSDNRDGADGESGGMGEWDMEQLEKAIAEKHGLENKNRPTAIVCRYFLDAVEKKQYGWFWQCPNGKECKYRHALPPGYIMKSQMKELLEAEAANQPSVEEIIEEERAKVDAKTPINNETFLQWRAGKHAVKMQAQAEKEEERRRKGLLTGREIFQEEGFVAADDLAAADDSGYLREVDEEAEFARASAAARERAAAAAAAASAGVGRAEEAGQGTTAAAGEKQGAIAPAAPQLSAMGSETYTSGESEDWPNIPGPGLSLSFGGSSAPSSDLEEDEGEELESNPVGAEADPSQAGRDGPTGPASPAPGPAEQGRKVPASFLRAWVPGVVQAMGDRVQSLLAPPREGNPGTTRPDRGRAPFNPMLLSRPGMLRVPLMTHQRLALGWMVARETRGCLPMGGMLADDQGVGKTLTTIALIIAAPPTHTARRSASPLERGSAARERAGGEEHPAGSSALLVKEEGVQHADIQDGAGLPGRRQGKEPVCLDLTAGGAGRALTPVKREPFPARGSPSLRGEVIEVDLLGDSDDAGPSAPPPGVARGKTVLWTPEREDAEPPPEVLHGGTLVVCPTSVLHQWAAEIKSKTTPEAGLTVHIYHGPGKRVLRRELASYSVVLTTYHSMTHESPTRCVVAARQAGKRGRDGDEQVVRRPGGDLFAIRWHRLVLDEGQCIKNAKTLTAHAACALRARCRWCLSGTPIQNSINDLFSYFKFLRYHPYDQLKTFQAFIKETVQPENGARAPRHLHAILQPVLLRRTKRTIIDGRPLLSLPEKRIELTTLTFSKQEEEFYQQLEAEAKTEFQRAQSEADPTRFNVLSMLQQLLRLRQACDHPQLVRNARSDFATYTPEEKAAAVRLTSEKRLALVELLSHGPHECTICHDLAECPVASGCGHVFCSQCIASKVTEAGHGHAERELAYHCPQCGSVLGERDAHSLAALLQARAEVEGTAPEAALPATEAQIASAAWRAAVAQPHSAKIRAVMRYLHRVLRAGSPAVLRLEPKFKEQDVWDLFPPSAPKAEKEAAERDKVIIFSQWTSMLNLLEGPLKISAFRFERLDGTMSVDARAAAIAKFSADPETEIMLISLKAASLGVNLTCANHVIVEEQAIDRAHRIGQTRTLHVIRYLVKGTPVAVDTIEFRMLELQNKKRALVAASFGEDASGEAAGLNMRLTAADIMQLFASLRPGY
ncbi:Zinc finger CCCH domain-containing protein 21 [Auxenochlorella protothecoides]|uniref:Zinc finger CCCH domain-containing protein 21 n=1 Tax=Auxenochlorella protothecoides TaxID=3075 RepID=A0A087SM39_AUXPR|nr:Zinc finger CCCH domain-containing protein 21 [Auxenochlorella protothecoides]KFM26793.1 Zinc finger CCCH domain-containing protein 21 [Auxenochlorella protothecoides]